MSLWEYKVITSGKGGFATPALLEKFLNDLGRDEWEIVTFQTQPDNFLAFTGLARRSTQRDWTLEDAAAAAAKAEAEKLRAEFEAKFKAAASPALAADEGAPSFLEEKVAPDDGFRKPIDTSHDDEPDAPDEEKDEWDKLTAAEEDELPTFFEAIKPHMRRNQRGPGMSVGVDYLAKKWDQSEDDLKGALVECGFVVPEDEDSAVEYLEYDGDLYWLNVNRRGELWINTKEKPRPVFRPVKAQKTTVEEEAKPDRRGRKADAVHRKHGTQEPSMDETAGAVASESAPEGGKPQTDENGATAGSTPTGPGPQDSRPEVPSTALPEGAALLARIRPQMRRNRRGPGGSGSASFLSRALKCREPDLVAAFESLGLVVPTSPGEKPACIEIENEVWWLNLDSRGGLWINGRDKKPGETLPVEATAEAPGGEASAEATVAPAETEVAPPESQPLHAVAGTPIADYAAPVAPVVADAASVAATGEMAAPPAAEPPDQVGLPTSGSLLAIVRGALKHSRSGAFSGKLEGLAEELNQSPGELLGGLTAAGLKVPERARERPAFVDQGGEVFWLSKNARGELWVNAKPAKASPGEGEAADDSAESASAEGGKKPRRSRPRKQPDSDLQG